MAILNSLMMTASGSGDTFQALEGELWAWGHGAAYGHLGLGDTTNYNTPQQVGALTDWTNNVGDWIVPVHHTIKLDGTLWGWGQNNHGQVGDGSTTTRSSPVQIGALTDWAQISNGDHCTAAIKSDGTLWTWGYGGTGEGGHGDTTSRCSPTQVGSLTDWASITSWSHNIVALKTDGTLWTCGYNPYGQLGQGDSVAKSSPVQVGSATNWIAIEVGNSAVRALASA